MNFSRWDKVKEMLRQNLYNKDESIQKKSLSIGFGVFMGIVPIWGFQMATALLLASIFRLNKALTLIASNISIPPMIPVIIFFSFLLGRIWIGENSISMMFNRHLDKHAVTLNIEQYIYGSITLAIIAGLLAYGITYLLLTLSGRRKKQMGLNN